MLALGEGWLHTPLSPAVTSPRHPWRQTELSSATGWEWPPHLHTGSSLGTGKGSSRSSCPCAPAAKLGQLSLHSKGFPVTPDHSGVPSRRRIPGSPSGCPGGVEQTKRCWAVLSCSSRSGDGHGKRSTRTLLLFLPSSSPCETFCAWCFPAQQSPVRQTWLLVWGDVGSSPLPCRLHLSLCCSSLGSWGSCVALARGKEGLAHRIRSCGTSQQPQALGITWCFSTCFVLWQTLLEVLRAVLISHPHLGTVASAPVQLQAEPLQVQPQGRMGLSLLPLGLSNIQPSL